MQVLWAASIPAVPIHDGLLAPASGLAAADAALKSGYMEVAGAMIQTKRSEPPRDFRRLQL
jgi:hypothetical protein